MVISTPLGLHSITSSQCRYEWHTRNINYVTNIFKLTENKKFHRIKLKKYCGTRWGNRLHRNHIYTRSAFTFEYVTTLVSVLHYGTMFWRANYGIFAYPLCFFARFHNNKTDSIIPSPSGNYTDFRPVLVRSR